MGRTALHWACLNGFDEFVRMLLKANADTETADNNLQTAVCMAAQRNQAEIVALLLNYQADPNKKDMNDRNAIIYACEHVNEDMIRHLLRAFVDVNVRDRDGKTPLNLIVDAGHKRLVKELVDGGAESDTIYDKPNKNQPNQPIKAFGRLN